MNYYSITICFILSLIANETKQFVEFKKSDVVVIEENSYTTVTLPFEVLSDYHIQSNSDLSNNLIATEITFKENNNYKIESQEFSLMHDETIVLNGDRHKVISNKFEVTVRLKINKNTSNLKLDGELYYQACTDRQCLFPRALNFQVSL